MLSPINVTTEGQWFSLRFFFNLFWLLMIGYQIPISLSCSFPSPAPCCSLEECFGEHLDAGCWIGSILAGPCAPLSALRAWTLGRGPQRRQRVGAGWWEKRKKAWKNTTYIGCELSQSIICFHAHTKLYLDFPQSNFLFLFLPFFLARGICWSSSARKEKVWCLSVL